MPLKFCFTDITKIKDIHAIVNSANPEPGIIGNGVEKSIYYAAGQEELMAERALRKTIQPGHVAITQSYKLLETTGAMYVIHTVTVPWCEGNNNELEILTACYTNALREAKANKCTQIAVPLLGTGAYRYPVDKAFDTAVKAINVFLKHNPKHTVIMCLVNSDAIEAAKNYIKTDCNAFIESSYIEQTQYEYNKNHLDMDEQFEHETIQIKRFKQNFNALKENEAQSCLEFIDAYKGDMDFPGILQALMTKHNVSRNDIANDKTKITKTYLSTWLTGKTIPDRGYILVTAIIMKLSEEEFLKFLCSAKYGPGTDRQYLAVLWHIRNQHYDLNEIKNFFKENNIEDFFKVKNTRRDKTDYEK